MRPEFTVSLMCMDYLHLAEQLKILDDLADGYHADIMDGHFCSNLALSPDLVAQIARATRLPVDVHLMTTEPERWLEGLAEAGVRIICPQAETINHHAYRVLGRIRELGCEPGVVLNPATPLEYVRPYIGRIKYLVLLCVDPGYAGQQFIPEVQAKVEAAARLRRELGLNYIIEVDGACGPATFAQLNGAGAQRYVLGTSGLFRNSADLKEAYLLMRRNFSRVTGVEL